ncbi:hypothetical protein [Sandarakinorhabdus sp. AAP62]|uniref:hypothetical protein n=1 Tax=Sandarakinorhabdus sp. AAP62 TaxID=1248916 RepID=UPI0002F59055|nr:hypothetical protein [Sandarakinorhabdus sp. AAP62]
MAGAARAAPAQTDDGAYTRYELLAPSSHKFRIVYDITATTPGARTYYNPIRAGSIATDEHVTDRATGAPLAFAEVDGEIARTGGVANAPPGSRYIAVTLARPVPEGGGGRIRIDKTYEDAKSYYSDGDAIVFDRSLGIKRNSIVLPAGYRLVSVNVLVQVLQQADGRIALSFLNASPAPMPLRIRAVPGGVMAAGSAMAARLVERAAQTREIVYYLREPDTHSFDLTHDYTEERAGVGAYVNVVRAGSTVSNPSARDLDTGAALATELVKGAAITAIDPRETRVTADTTAVVFRFPPVAAGGSRRIRIAETYTDPDRYRVVAGELVWHRAFGRPANAVVLPAGWMLANSTIPAAISTTADGRTRLDFLNPRPDDIDVVITARRMP